MRRWTHETKINKEMNITDIKKQKSLASVGKLSMREIK